MSDSDGSEQLGFLAEQSDGHESDASDEPNDSHDENDSESSEDAANGLLDLEAVDSDEEERSGSDESDAEHDGFGSNAWSEDYFFPQFKRLPLELRTRIWEFFCPDFGAKSRVYSFQVSEYRTGSGHRGFLTELSVHEGPFLEQQTRAARAMLAVHHESRQLALRAFPDALSFGTHGLLRFNSHRDIVVLRATMGVFQFVDEVAPIPGFSEHIRHLAIDPTVLSELFGRPSVLLDAFENLETAFYATNAADHEPQHLRWCTSDLAKRYYFETFEEHPGVGEEAQLMYCWPDVDKHGTQVANKIPLAGLEDEMREYYPGIHAPEFNGVPIWPLVEFFWRYGLQRFDKLAVWDGKAKLDWGEFGDDDSDREEPDEYESEGIDDSDISDDDDDDDGPGGDLIVLDDDDSDQDGEGSDDSDQDEEDSDDSSSAVSGSPGAQNHGETIDLTGDDDEHIAEFSSPEQSSATLQGSDESGDDSKQPAPRTSRLKRRRGRVVASDSEEDDSEDDLPRKRARTENRGAPIILSSDNEEDEVRKIRVNQRARAVGSEDEDEEEDEEAGAGQSGGSSSEEDDEDSERGAAVSKPMSLAQKLQLHRERNPIPASDDEDPDIEEMRGDDYDAQDYADFQDDEEGNEVSDDGEDDEQELVMDDEDDAEEDDEY